MDILQQVAIEFAIQHTKTNKSKLAASVAQKVALYWLQKTSGMSVPSLDKFMQSIKDEGGMISRQTAYAIRKQLLTEHWLSKARIVEKPGRNGEPQVPPAMTDPQPVRVAEKEAKKVANILSKIAPAVALSLAKYVEKHMKASQQLDLLLQQRQSGIPVDPAEINTLQSMMLPPRDLISILKFMTDTEVVAVRAESGDSAVTVIFKGVSKKIDVGSEDA